AIFLKNESAVNTYSKHLKEMIQERLYGYYEGFFQLKEEGFPVDVISPQAAIYLTVKIDLSGYQTKDGRILNNPSEVTQYLLNAAGIALVPFYAFGASKDSSWY